MKSQEAPILFAPGPVDVHERIRQAMALPVVHHRAVEFRNILGDVREQLKWLWQCDWDSLVFSCSGTGAMEGAVVNFMKKGAKAINVSAGKFGERWARILEAYGCEAIELKLDWGKTTGPDEVVELLRKHPDVRAVFLTSADTSTGVSHPIETIAPAIRANSDALVIVDCICDFGGARNIRPREWEIDVAVSASQKCLMLPPGLGLATVSPRAWEYAKTADLPRFYFDWHKEREREEENLTAYTSAVSLIRGLHESLSMLQEEGLENVLRRYARLAAGVRAGARGLGLELLPDSPSNALNAIKGPAGLDCAKLTAHIATEYGYRLANGQDHLNGQIFRVSNMGKRSESDILGVLHVIERGLRDLGVDIKPGTAAAAAEQAFRSDEEK